jgi:hypothetical protein
MTSHKSRNKRGKTKAELSELFQTVEDNPTLLVLLETATTSARPAIFIKTLLETGPILRKSIKVCEDGH